MSRAHCSKLSHTNKECTLMRNALDVVHNYLKKLVYHAVTANNWKIYIIFYIFTFHL